MHFTPETANPRGRLALGPLCPPGQRWNWIFVQLSTTTNSISHCGYKPSAQVNNNNKIVINYINWWNAFNVFVQFPIQSTRTHQRTFLKCLSYSLFIHFTGISSFFLLLYILLSLATPNLEMITYSEAKNLTTIPLLSFFNLDSVCGFSKQPCLFHSFQWTYSASQKNCTPFRLDLYARAAFTLASL